MAQEILVTAARPMLRHKDGRLERIAHYHGLDGRIVFHPSLRLQHGDSIILTLTYTDQRTPEERAAGEPIFTTAMVEPPRTPKMPRAKKVLTTTRTKKGSA